MKMAKVLIASIFYTVKRPPISVKIKKLSINITKFSHSWNLNRQEAVELQQKLARQLKLNNRINLRNVKTVAGIDTHYHNGLAAAAVACLRVKDLATVEYASAVRRVSFPYIPGLLSFREGPVVLDALDKLGSLPDVLICDGQGIAHPRRFGLACHIGLLLDKPSIGCAKTWLTGGYAEPGRDKGEYSYLRDGREVIGAVVRTRKDVKPLYVSVGHQISLQDSIQIVIRCCRRYRLPEPLRLAHQIAGDLSK
ncbi:MAG: deoxyribonuclease V [Desulfobacterales bacterium]